MAGEYVRWLARDVKPREKQELTPQEKRRNWWAYHKWYLLAALVCAVLVGNVIQDAAENSRNRADYVVAYVGQTAMPEELERILEEGLAGLGEDRNGNGVVRVELRQYLMTDFTSSMTLVAGIEANESLIFFLEDPQWFQAEYPILCLPDGTQPQEGSGEQLYLRWGDCPVLTQLPLEGIGTQELLENLAIARRGAWTTEPDEDIESGIDLWERMTAGMR